MTKSELEKLAASSQRNDQAPPIIVRLNRRELKDKLMAACKKYNTTVNVPSI